MRIASARTNFGSWRVAAMTLVAASVLVACGGSDSPPGSDLPESGVTRPPLTAPPTDDVPVQEPAPEEPPAEEPPAEEPPTAAPAPDAPPATTAPPAVEPPAEEPAAAGPAPEEPLAAAQDDEGLTSEERALLIALGLIALAIAVGAAALASRRSRGRAEEDTTNQRRLDDITRACRSIHDSAVISVLQMSDQTQLHSTWAAVRTQLVDLEARVASLGPELSDERQRRSLHELGLAVAGVRGALESNVGLRMEPAGTGQGELIEAANRTVLYRSEQLESALQQVLYLKL